MLNKKLHLDLSSELFSLQLYGSAQKKSEHNSECKLTFESAQAQIFKSGIRFVREGGQWNRLFEHATEILMLVMIKAACTHFWQPESLK